MDSPRDMVPPGRGSRCPALRRLVPVGFGAEARTLIVLSGPLFLFQMLNFMIYVVSSVFCGHLGKVELAAVTLSVAFVNVCGVSIGFGLSSACDTLMSQPQQEARGSHPAARRAGSAALLLSLLGALPQHPAHPAALQAGPGRVQAGPGVRACLYPSAPGKFSLQPAGQISAKPGHHVAPSPQRRRGQLRQRAGQLRPGFRAGPGGQVSTGAGGPASGGRGQLRQRAGQLRPGFRAGPGGQIPMGLSIAVCFRVGTALGAADTVQAKRSAVSGTLCTVGTSLVVGTLLGLLRNKLGHIFTNDEEVVALVGKVLPLYVIFHLFEAVCCLYGGVLRGTGRQAFGAVVNAVTYYVVGLPLGVVLTFVVGLGITGLWLGMLACVFLAAAAFVTYTACMDWKRAAEEWSGACEVCLCVTTSCSACRAQLRPGWTAGRPDNSVSFRCRNVWGCRPRPLRAQPPASDPGLRERSYLQKGFAELCAISSCQVFSGRELPPVTDNRETTQKIKTQSW
ncbi:multidrug and toxin extrusion protein 2-like isoform X13 [Neophocaena asiaeorientalis asiaeorientalis]|uniref:Multidrug and toxin extrusion protein n=1 Tax=Neophocaena asiaeorientalis asiaeorientalis TaxID=1706337 RepID=A0A341C2Y9_NEOAA|nr:multidrug and toxin extrusion protein 2-like isoform X13 [Neophocaena asiaeorientalis asiaeorientalis]